MSRYCCKSVVGGWVTFDNVTGQEVGPIFNSATDLWKWQKESLLSETTQTPCNEHSHLCVNDGKHGRDEEWVCQQCGDREYR